ncbi:MAG: FUSC family protein, partial [Thermomicrobiales bacterium]
TGRPIRRVLAAMRPDWTGFSWKLGTIATLMIAGVIVAAQSFGAAGLFAGMGALQAVLASVAAPMKVRPWAAFWFAAVGCGTTALAAVVARDHGLAVASLAVVAFLAGCGGAVGPVSARMTNVMAIWFLTATALLQSSWEVTRPALGFLLGSAIVFTLLELYKRVKGIEVAGAPPTWATVRERLAWGSPVLSFALVYAVAGAVALEIGWRVMPENRVWPAITALVLIRPAAGASVVTALQRMAGTLVGAWAIVAIVPKIDDPKVLLGIVLLSTFMMAATMRVSYAIFALFMTGMVVALAALSGKDPFQTGNDRVLGTVIGAAVAMAAVMVMHLLPTREVEMPELAGSPQPG